MAQVMIPLVQGTNQTLTCTLPINGGNVELTFSFTYNTPGSYWYMSITDANNTLLLDGIPLVCGSPPYDILAPYQYLNIGSAYLVPTSSGLPDIPNFNTLGASPSNPNAPTFQLIWSDNVNYVA